MAETSNDKPLRYFVDSNIIGYVIQAKPLGFAYLDLMEQMGDMLPSVSTTVVNEITAGLAGLDRASHEQRRLADAMSDGMAMFEVVPIDRATVTIAKELKRHARRVGHPVGAESQRSDLDIEALAIRHHAPLISHNYRDFVNIDALDLRTLAHIKKNPPRIAHLFD